MTVQREVHARGTQVVDRVFDIIDAFIHVGPELSVTDVSRRVGLKYSTAHRLLEAMARRGILDRDPETRRYRIGLQLRQVALASIGQVDLLDHARPFLEELTKATGETSHLAVFDDGMALYVDKVESQRMLSRPSHVGRRLPTYCTGVGKAMLASLPAEVVDAVLSGDLQQFTANTITDPARLRAEMATIRQQGYAVDNEEIEEGLVCVAAAIRDRDGRVIAGISIGGPASRVRKRGVEIVAREVTQSARAIEVVVGWPEGRSGKGGANSDPRKSDPAGVR